MELVEIQKAYIGKGLPSYLRGIQRAGVFPQGVKYTSEGRGAIGNRVAAHSYGKMSSEYMGRANRAKTGKEFGENAMTHAALIGRGREAKATAKALQPRGF